MLRTIRECQDQAICHLDAAAKESRNAFFAYIKRVLGPGRLRLRGPCGADGEFLLAALRSDHFFLHQQHIVFLQKPLNSAIGCSLFEGLQRGRSSLTSSQWEFSRSVSDIQN